MAGYGGVWRKAESGVLACTLIVTWLGMTTRGFKIHPDHVPFGSVPFPSYSGALIAFYPALGILRPYLVPGLRDAILDKDAIHCTRMQSYPCK